MGWGGEGSNVAGELGEDGGRGREEREVRSRGRGTPHNLLKKQRDIVGRGRGRDGGGGGGESPRRRSTCISIAVVGNRMVHIRGMESEAEQQSKSPF